MQLLNFILLFFFLSSCASYSGPQSFSLQEDIIYAIKEEVPLKADLYTPELNDGELAPAVILVHGGGWRSRSKADMGLIAESLAEHGFVVMNINYRLAPKFKHPAPAQDLKSAHEFLIKNALNYKFNQELPIGLWGYSSGGHTISYYVSAMKNQLAGKVGAVVSGGSPYFLTWYPKSPYLKDYLGGFREEKLEEHFEASINTHFHSQLPPYFFYHAREDELVELAQSTAFQALFEREGIETELFIIEYWGHTLAFAFSSESVEKGVIFFKSQLKQANEVDRTK
jgi:acetyl esterase/lipase